MHLAFGFPWKLPRRTEVDYLTFEWVKGVVLEKNILQAYLYQNYLPFAQVQCAGEKHVIWRKEYDAGLPEANMEDALYRWQCSYMDSSGFVWTNNFLFAFQFIKSCVTLWCSRNEKDKVPENVRSKCQSVDLQKITVKLVA